MADRYLSQKCGVNPLDGFQENDAIQTDGWRNHYPRHDSSSAVQYVAQSRAKSHKGHMI